MGNPARKRTATRIKCSIQNAARRVLYTQLADITFPTNNFVPWSQFVNGKFPLSGPNHPCRLRGCSELAALSRPKSLAAGTLVFLNQSLKIKWRRERDSNPRKDCSFTGLANLRFRPLSHLSSPHYSNRPGQITQANSHAAGQIRPLRRAGPGFPGSIRASCVG
jgi:hypothetical protein